MKLLSIGNSFSQDAHRYLTAFAHAMGDELDAHDLVIGGCPLVLHRDHYESGAEAYYYEHNGEYTGHMASSSAFLQEGDWDVITIQQVSHEAGKPETFEPYLGTLIPAFRAACPGAKLAFQETWEYEYCSAHGGFPYYKNDCDVMFGCVKDACRAAAQRYDLTLIPSGEVIHEVKRIPEFDSEHGGQSLYRDAFHMHLVYGRYLLACVWYKTLFGKSPVGCTFIPTDGESDPALLRLLQEAADRFSGR